MQPAGMVGMNGRAGTGCGNEGHASPPPIRKAQQPLAHVKTALWVNHISATAVVQFDFATSIA